MENDDILKTVSDIDETVPFIYRWGALVSLLGSFFFSICGLVYPEVAMLSCLWSAGFAITGIYFLSYTNSPYLSYVIVKKKRLGKIYEIFGQAYAKAEMYALAVEEMTKSSSTNRVASVLDEDLGIEPKRRGRK